MKLEDYLDIDKLKHHVNAGFVSKRPHFFLPLDIYCYTKKTTFEDVWDDVTCKTRGLIADHNGVIVARPWEKFWNLEHLDHPEVSMKELQKETEYPTILEKLDGSLGIYYEYMFEDRPGAILHRGIATKGSFHSEQAKWATMFYNHRVRSRIFETRWPKGYTPLFEIICQDVEHHVLHYKPEEDNRLILLDMVNIETGSEEFHGQVIHWGQHNGFPVADIHSQDCVYWHEGRRAYEVNWLSLRQHRDNKEGFVISWPREGKPWLKVKVKHADFIVQQRIAHNITPHYVFDILSGKKETEMDLDYYLGRVNQHLRLDMEEWVIYFRAAYGDIFDRSMIIMREALQRCTSRQQFSEFFLQENHKKYQGVLFSLLDEKYDGSQIWSLLDERKIWKEVKHRIVVEAPDGEEEEE